MNECKRCGNQSEVLYDIHGVLVCIHCAVANGVKARTLDEVIAENEQQAARIQDLESRLAARLTGGVEEIASERAEQILKHGWTDAHDDSYTDGQLALAAYAYCLPESERPGVTNPDGTFVPSAWPWAEHWFRPSPDNRIRELAIAGALIAAEIDRLQRLQAPTP